MAVYTVSLRDTSGLGQVNVGDGTFLAKLSVAAGRGPKGDGWTSVTYDENTGTFIFTSNDGLEYTSPDLRPELQTYVTAAEAAQAGAEAAETATEALFDQFGDQYLGPKASDPTVDNDGDPLTEGDIYFNTTDDVLKFYSGSTWVAPESIATTAATAAQAAQAAAETAETNAETAEANAAASETAAATSETNAGNSEVAAASSAAAASTSADEAAASVASIDLDNIDINGGTIDGTVIGGTTPAAVSGTTGQFDTSLNVDGSVTADGLTVDGIIETTNGTDINMDSAASGQLKLEGNAYKSAIALNADGMNVYTNSASRGIILGTNETQRLRVAGNGDVSFYEDTGSTPKFFWDASAERLGIGTVSPTTALDVTGAIKATDLTLSSGALNGVTSSDTFKRVVQAGVVSDFSSYTTTTTQALAAQGSIVQITPQSPGNTKVIGVFSVDLRSSVSVNTTDAGTNLIVKYYNGSAYVNTGSPRSPLIASNLAGNASLDDEISIPFELSNAQRRSDTGRWTVRIYYSCVYANNSSTIYSGNVIFWEVDE